MALSKVKAGCQKKKVVFPRKKCLTHYVQLLFLLLLIVSDYFNTLHKSLYVKEKN